MEAIYADLDQIVFENKEKAYGGYAIRQQAGRMLTRATLIGLLMFLSITALPKIISWAFPAIPVEKVDPPVVYDFDVDLKDIPVIEQKTEKIALPPNLPKPPVHNIKTIAFAIANPTPEKDLKESEEIRSIEDILDGNVGVKDIDGEDGPPIIPWENIDKEIDNKFPPVFEEEHDEKDVNGMDRLPEAINMEDFKSKIVYSDIARDNNIYGMVVVKIRVERDGTYIEHEVIKSPHELLTKAVEAQIKTLRFLPALKRGKPVRFWVTIPVNFALIR